MGWRGAARWKKENLVKKEKQGDMFFLYSSVEHCSWKGPGILAHQGAWSYRILIPLKETHGNVRDGRWLVWVTHIRSHHTPSLPNWTSRYFWEPGDTTQGPPTVDSLLPVPLLPNSSLSPNPQRAEGAELKSWKFLFVSLSSTESQFSFRVEQG